MRMLARLCILSMVLYTAHGNQVQAADAAPPAMPELKLPDAGTPPPLPPLPSPLSQLPPLPDENSSNLLDGAHTPQAKKKEPPAAVAKATPPETVKEEPKPGKHAKKARHHVVVRAKSNYFRSERLPEAIYRKSYDAANKHLPIAHYESEYDALVFLTAEHDDLNGLRAMLGTGRSVNLVNRAGDTLLLAAVKHNAINTARLLLALRANPNAEDKNGMSALAIATRMGNYPMIRALQEMGASPAQISSAQ